MFVGEAENLPYSGVPEKPKRKHENKAVEASQGPNALAYYKHW